MRPGHPVRRQHGDLRAQTLAEPVRTRSLELLQRQRWRLAGLALDAAPTASAPRLYVESLNQMIDLQTVRVSALGNRVPGAVLALEVAGAAVALGVLAFYLAILGRGVLTVLVAATPLTELRASMALPPAATGPSDPSPGPG